MRSCCYHQGPRGFVTQPYCIRKGFEDCDGPCLKLGCYSIGLQGFTSDNAGVREGFKKMQSNLISNLIFHLIPDANLYRCVCCAPGIHRLVTGCAAMCNGFEIC